MRRSVLVVLVGAAAVVLLLWAGEIGLGPVVITHEDEQKIVLLFGNPVSIRTEPGPSLRIPLLTDVQTFDKRMLYLNTEPLPIQTRDEERLEVDNYVAWRIEKPLDFYKAFGTGLEKAEAHIDQVVRADVRRVVGQRTISEVVTEDRVGIMDDITRESRRALEKFGVEIHDVRINRTELPGGAEQNVYARMRAERQRRARKYRAEGEEQGRRIRAEADREAQEIVGRGHRDAEVLRGVGDAEAAQVYAEAHAAAPEFYGFVRRLEAYRKTIGARTTLVLPPESEFFRLFGEELDREPTVPRAPEKP